MSLIYIKKEGSQDGALGYTTICIAYFRGASTATYHLRSFFQIRSYQIQQRIFNTYLFEFEKEVGVNNPIKGFRSVVLKTFWLVGHICLSETLCGPQELIISINII